MKKHLKYEMVDTNFNIATIVWENSSNSMKDISFTHAVQPVVQTAQSLFIHLSYAILRKLQIFYINHLLSLHWVKKFCIVIVFYIILNPDVLLQEKLYENASGNHSISEPLPNEGDVITEPVNYGKPSVECMIATLRLNIILTMAQSQSRRRFITIKNSSVIINYNFFYYISLCLFVNY